MVSKKKVSRQHLNWRLNIHPACSDLLRNCAIQLRAVGNTGLVKVLEILQSLPKTFLQCTQLLFQIIASPFCPILFFIQSKFPDL